MEKDKKPSLSRQEIACVVGGIFGSATTMAFTVGFFIGTGYSPRVPELLLSGMVGTAAGCAMGTSVEQVCQRRKR